MSSTEIAVVIILYNPSEEDISHSMKQAALWYGVIVDNSAEPFTDNTRIGNMLYICNRKNVGIAEAQNIGLRAIGLETVRFVVFLDQDTRFSSTYPEKICTEFETISKVEQRLAILGPTVINKTSGQEYASVIHHYDVDSLGFSQRRQVISSGSCVSAQALLDVGLMDASLFIDSVDYEWCWRATARKYVCGITTKMSISHQVGSRELNIGKYKVIISAPFRYYYQYRNFLWLLRRKYVPLQWKIATGVKFAARFIYFPLFVRGGRERWKYMCQGIKAGIKGRKV